MLVSEEVVENQNFYSIIVFCIVVVGMRVTHDAKVFFKLFFLSERLVNCG